MSYVNIIDFKKVPYHDANTHNYLVAVMTQTELMDYRIPDGDCCFHVLLKAGRTVAGGAQAFLNGGHEALQVLCEVLVLIAKQVDLQRRVVDHRAVLPLGHSLQDPQHLHRGVVEGVHQVEETLHKVFAQEDRQLSGKALVVPQDDVQDHEEAIDGAGVGQVDFDVQGRA